MSKIEYLKNQAARAERLASPALDKLTAQRLRAYVEECRTQIEFLAAVSESQSVPRFIAAIARRKRQ